MELFETQLRVYSLSGGRVPYFEWLYGLRDLRAKQKIQARIARIRLGNFGQTRSIGSGVQELKIDYGPGYRIYFGQDGEKLLILLCGGDKSTQAKDIKAAKKYWMNYKKEENYAKY